MDRDRMDLYARHINPQVAARETLDWYRTIEGVIFACEARQRRIARRLIHRPGTIRRAPRPLAEF